MRDPEQPIYLALIGLMASKVNSLQVANDGLKGYGPELFHGDRITLNKKAQHTCQFNVRQVHFSQLLKSINMSFETYIYVQNQGASITITVPLIFQVTMKARGALSLP